jgi:hypothetical protein
MDVGKILAELKAERKQIEEAVLSLEQLARGRGRGRGPGRPPGSNDPGSQPPPAAPASARIAGRLDRGVSGRKLPEAS